MMAEPYVESLSDDLSYALVLISCFFHMDQVEEEVSALSPSSMSEENELLEVVSFEESLEPKRVENHPLLFY
jgi:hypothetical protein